MTQARAVIAQCAQPLAVALVLAAAFAANFMLHELPCPLCLLQRILFAMLAVGPILTLRSPHSRSHAISLLAAVAARQSGGV